MRELGYYWIIPKRDRYFGREGWQIAYWNGEFFWTEKQDGCDFLEDECERIHEVRIKTPDENL